MERYTLFVPPGPPLCLGRLGAPVGRWPWEIGEKSPGLYGRPPYEMISIAAPMSARSGMSAKRRRSREDLEQRVTKLIGIGVELEESTASLRQ
jgi:hypothetical protein